MENLGTFTINDLQNFEVTLSFGSVAIAMILSALLVGIKLDFMKKN